MSDRAIVFDRRAERVALKAIARGLPSSRTLLGKLDESFFGNDVNRIVFRRIKQQVKKRNAIPTWRDLVMDPSFDNTTVTGLKGFTENVTVNKQTCQEIYDRLTVFRKRRILDNISKKINESLMKPPGQIDEDAIIKGAADQVSLARSKRDHAAPLALGKGARYKERLERLLSGVAIPLWPTGFDDFDSRGGGFAIGSLVLIGGYTASGKGFFSGSLANNFADYGLRVGEISIEMDEDEVLLRRASALTNTLQDKILKASQEPLTEKEKQQIRDGLAKKVDEWARKGSGVYTHNPKTSVDIHEAISMVEMYDYNVIILDYASLLDGVGGSDFWQKLGEVCRLGKLYAQQHKAVFIILIQTDKLDNVKFSNSMLMHADYAFVLKHSDTRDEDDYTEIELPKVRKISAKPFVVARDLAYARFGNYTGQYKPGDKIKVTTEKPTRLSGSRDQQGQPRQKVDNNLETDEELEAIFSGVGDGDL